MVFLAFHLQPMVNEKSIGYLNDNGEGVVAFNHLTEKKGGRVWMSEFNCVLR